MPRKRSEKGDVNSIRADNPRRKDALCNHQFLRGKKRIRSRVLNED